MRIASGIISIIVALIILFQSFSASIVGNLVDESLAVAGAGGLWIAILLIFAGAFAFKLPRVAAYFSVIAALMSFPLAENSTYKDLYVWGGIALLVTIFNYIESKRK